MPYIAQEVRRRLDRDVKSADSLTTIAKSLVGPGQLNYTITRLCLGYIPDVPQYFNFNEVIGVLECVKLELYRRAVAPYESKKCMEHGDVY